MNKSILSILQKNLIGKIYVGSVEKEIQDVSFDCHDDGGDITFFLVLEDATTIYLYPDEEFNIKEKS